MKDNIFGEIFEYYLAKEKQYSDNTSKIRDGIVSPCVKCTMKQCENCYFYTYKKEREA